MGVESEGNPMTRYRPPMGSTERARRLRLDATRAERAMWRLLRDMFPVGRFRRQVPIRDYIADFASHRLKLAIEVDGVASAIDAALVPESTPALTLPAHGGGSNTEVSRWRA